MQEATTVVKIDEQGRLYVPKPVREALGIEGDEKHVEIKITVEDDNDRR